MTGEDYEKAARLFAKRLSETALHFQRSGLRFPMRRTVGAVTIEYDPTEKKFGDQHFTIAWGDDRRPLSTLVIDDPHRALPVVAEALSAMWTQGLLRRDELIGQLNEASACLEVLGT